MPILAIGGLVGLLALTGGFKDISKILKWLAFALMAFLAYMLLSGKAGVNIG